MRRLLLSLVLLLSLTLTSSAQRPNPRYYRHRPVSVREARQAPQTSFGALRLHVVGALGDGDLFRMLTHRCPDMVTLGGMMEYKLGDFVGVGLGVEYYASAGRGLGDALNDYLRSLPLYANLRLSLPGGVRPFVEGRVGYAVPLGSAAAYHDGASLCAMGLHTGVGAGVEIGRSSLSVGFSVTDCYRAGSASAFGDGFRGSFSDVCLRYSFAFGI